MAMSRTIDELQEFSKMDPEYREWVEKYPVPDMGSDTSTIRSRRNAHLDAQRPYLPFSGPIPEVKEEDIHIPIRDGDKLPVRIYTPDISLVPPTGSPVYVAYHEGGWMWGDKSDEDANCRMISKEFGAVCVNVEYRLAPEHPFPTGILDCWDALQWVASNATSLKANPAAGFVIGGASAGGNISAVLAHVARNESLEPPLTGHFMCVPAVMPPCSVPQKWQAEYRSWIDNINDPVLPRGEGETLYDKFMPLLQLYDLKHPLFNPVEDPRGCKGLPRAYFQVAGMDPLRDEGILYERLLREEGDVETRINIYPGFGHMFWTNYPRMEKCKEYFRDTVEGFRWLLQR